MINPILIQQLKGWMKMKYGIYVDNIRIWGMFKTQEQAFKFIEDYDLTENPYEVRSYY